MSLLFNQICNCTASPNPFGQHDTLEKVHFFLFYFGLIQIFNDDEKRKTLSDCRPSRAATRNYRAKAVKMFPSFPLAKLRARMICYNWQVLRRELEWKANELVALSTIDFALICFSDFSSSLRENIDSPRAFLSRARCFSQYFSWAKSKTRPIVSAFRQITDSTCLSSKPPLHMKVIIMPERWWSLLEKKALASPKTEPMWGEIAN